MTPDARFRDALLASLPDGVPVPTDPQVASMYAWYESVVEANQRFNLTRISDPAEAAVKHFADSLAVLGWAERLGYNPVRVLDVGTGAGFPAVPLAMMRPGWRVTAIDSTGKKACFVSETAARLGLANLTALHARAGLWKPNELYDLVLFKAVGSMADCLTQTQGLVGQGGYLLHFKTSDVSDAERAEAAAAAARLGLTASVAHGYGLVLGGTRMERVLVVFTQA